MPRTIRGGTLRWAGAKAGYVTPSNSKSKSRSTTLLHHRSGPLDPSTDFRRRIQCGRGLEGLDDHGAVIVKTFKTWRNLGEMSDEKFGKLLNSIPAKRVHVPEDMQDDSRVGPGHLWLIEKMRNQARQEAFAALKDRRQAHAEYKALLAYRRPVESSLSMAAPK